MKSKHDLFSLLTHRIGAQYGTSVKTLSDLLRTTPRQVRKLVSELRMDGIAVCGTPETGYYIAADAEELQQTIDFLKHRALHSLTLASRMSKIPMPDLIGQLHVPT